MNPIIQGFIITTGGGLVLYFIIKLIEKIIHSKRMTKKKTNSIVDKKIMDDLRILEAIESPLLRMNSILRFSPTHKQVIEWLYEIKELANQIKSKEFHEIKSKLLEYVERMNRQDANDILGMSMILFGRSENSAIYLVEEIRKIVSEKIGKRDNKKQK